MSQGNNNTKEQILEASLDLFASKGFHGTSMREIAQEVGIRKSSIYNHFSSKDDLLESLTDIYGPGSIANSFKKILNSEINQEPYLLLKSIGNIIFQIIVKPEEQKFLRLLLREHNNEIVRDALKESLYSKTRLLIADLFQDLMDRGLIKKGDPLVYVNEFIGPVIFFRIIDILLLYDGEEFKDLKNYIDNHIDFFWNAIKI